MLVFPCFLMFIFKHGRKRYPSAPTIIKIVKAFEIMRQVCSSSLPVKAVYSGRKCGWPFSQERSR